VKLYTIGFTKKSAKEFFELLGKNGIKTVFDVRLNNKSQLAGFTKYPDVMFFLKELNGIEYIHIESFAPTDELLKGYKKKEISWEEYVKTFNQILNDRNINKKIQNLIPKLDKGCLLCSEPTADQCHRRLVAEHIKTNFPDLDLEIIHL